MEGLRKETVCCVSLVVILSFAYSIGYSFA